MFLNSEVNLIGRLGQDADVRRTESGIPYAQISIGCDSGYFDKEKGEWVNRVDWIPVTLWRKEAEKAEKSFKKGNMVRVKGRLTHGKSIGKDLKESWNYSILVQDAECLVKKQTTAAPDEATDPQAGAPSTPSTPRAEKAAKAVTEDNFPTLDESSVPTAPDDDLPF